MRSLGSVLALALLLAATTASAAPFVYHSPGDSGDAPGPPAGPPYLPKAANVTLYLWIDPGATALAGTICADATGDASCAYDLRVQVQGDSKIKSATLSGDVIQHISPDEKTLRANRIAKSPPYIVGKQKIGQIVVDTTGPLGGSIEVTGVHSLGAALQVDRLPSNTLAYVPEPGQLLLLVSGLAGLALLHRLRGTR
jgi:hypothetical protein